MVLYQLVTIVYAPLSIKSAASAPVAITTSLEWSGHNTHNGVCVPFCSLFLSLTSMGFGPVTGNDPQYVWTLLLCFLCADGVSGFRAARSPCLMVPLACRVWHVLVR